MIEILKNYISPYEIINEAFDIPNDSIWSFAVWKMPLYLIGLYVVFYFVKFIRGDVLIESHDEIKIYNQEINHEPIRKKILQTEYHVKCEYCSSVDIPIIKNELIHNCIHCNAPLNYDSKNIIKTVIEIQE
jgi:hypothetical protein